MLKINKSKHKVKKSSELEIFLSTGMEIFGSQNIKKQNKKIKNQKSNIDTDEKIDKLLSNYEKTVKNNQNSDKKEKKDTKPYLEFVEIRQSIEKKPQAIESDAEKNLFGNKTTKKSIEEAKEITFNIKEDKSNTKELTFNVSKNDDKIQKLEGTTDKKKNNKKRFFLFKSKKNESNQNRGGKESEVRNQNLQDEKIKSTSKKKLLLKNQKSIKKSNDYDRTDKQKDHENKNDEEIIEKEKTFFDEDIKKVLLITDHLLEKLPEDVINEFIKSKDFELYERVINKIK